MKADIKKWWVDALRSGEYKQGRGRLQDAYGRYCCLGVLCAVAVRERAIYSFLGSDLELPQGVVTWAGLDSRDPSTDGTRLATWNDGYLRDFSQIADLIEQHIGEE